MNKYHQNQLMNLVHEQYSSGQFHELPTLIFKHHHHHFSVSVDPPYAAWKSKIGQFVVAASSIGQYRTSCCPQQTRPLRQMIAFDRICTNAYKFDQKRSSAAEAHNSAC
jgi:hypothetical protein